MWIVEIYKKKILSILYIDFKIESNKNSLNHKSYLFLIIVSQKGIGFMRIKAV